MKNSITPLEALGQAVYEAELAALRERRATPAKTLRLVDPIPPLRLVPSCLDEEAK